MLTDSVNEKTETIQSFKAQTAGVKNSHFSQTDFVDEHTWNNSNFWSSNSLLKNFILFANPLRVWDNLNYFFQIQSLISLLKKSIFSQTDSFYEIILINSNFRISNNLPQNFIFFRKFIPSIRKKELFQIQNLIVCLENQPFCEPINSIKLL